MRVEKLVFKKPVTTQYQARLDNLMYLGSLSEEMIKKNFSGLVDPVTESASPESN